MHLQFTPADVARFWSKVDRSGECWLWTASVNVSGYGQVNFGKTMRRAHRIAWMLMNGPVPVDLCVLHRCDNRRCVRPDHLFLGTRPDNTADMVAKGRAAGPQGEAHPRATVTAEQVRAIRARYALGGISQSQLARDVGIRHQTVHLIVTGQSWRHILREEALDEGLPVVLEGDVPGQ